MTIISMKRSIVIAIVCLIASFSSQGIFSQRRQRPGSVKHTEQDVQNQRRRDLLSCKYVCDGHTFTGDVYYTGQAGAIKIGTASLVFKGGNYSLDFKGDKFKVRDALTPKDRHKYNPWRYEKIFNDLTQTGRYETFKKSGQIYLRLYDGHTDNYITDIPLSSVYTQSFILDEEGLRFEFSL